MSVLSWPGCGNVRDLGGLPTLWGGRTRTGALVRSARPGPPATPALLGYGVRLVVDLRLAAECAADPSPLAGHPCYRNLSVLRDEDRVLEAMGDTLPAIYRAVLDRGADRLARVVTAIARAEPGAVLLHCHAGRDRTGLAVALALASPASPTRTSPATTPAAARACRLPPRACGPRSPRTPCCAPSPTCATSTAGRSRTSDWTGTSSGCCAPG
ncbi:tyrosine-protein phosphatase [Thermocatellispora tengchongensis]|uniref:tyrosine-protein phosphatase n=1 Tax=Thermocatellispora tengchongensis TaxID=1073253 RepID=UPI00363A2DB8